MLADKIFPGCQKVDVTNIDSGNSQSNLFSFFIEHFGQPTYVKDFIQTLDQYLPSVILSKSSIELLMRQRREGLTTLSDLNKSRKFLRKTSQAAVSTSGELGEIMLGIFAKEIIGAQKLVSKMMNRDTRAANLKGRDSIYAYQDENNTVYMLIGESKTYADSNDALRIAHEDLKKFWQSSNALDHELQLASTHMHEEMKEENFKIYESYFIDDSEARGNLKYKNVIFIAYSSTGFTELIRNPTDTISFHDKIRQDLTRGFTNQKNLIQAGPHASIYCFLPFECVDGARKAFAEHHGLIE